jgi:hypothetical protein
VLASSRKRKGIPVISSQAQSEEWHGITQLMFLQHLASSSEEELANVLQQFKVRPTTHAFSPVFPLSFSKKNSRN